LRALARRGGVERPTVLDIGNLRLDPAARLVIIAGREQELTAREFGLLEYFARHADQVLSRTQIIEEVWDWAFEGTPRIIDVYVLALRAHLGRDPGSPRLETVRGVGYVLRRPDAGRVRRPPDTVK